MNLDSCAGCHLYPDVGGSSPATNPQIAFATKYLGKDNVPSFLKLNGPVRETRFVRNPDGSPDGGVHALFTISGRTNPDGSPSGAEKCSLTQPDYDTQLAKNNVVFRIPTPTFGGGLIESIPDSAIIANANKNSSTKSLLGIRGRPNFTLAGLTISGQTNNNGNDGTIARFGWKAQNKSLLVFSGEAYNVEMGITNEVFPTATEEDPGCQGSNKPEPNDVTRTDPNDAKNQSFYSPVHIMADWMQFSLLMRFTDGPAPDSNPGASAIRGKRVFDQVGCSMCHTPAMQTAPVMNSPVLQDRPVNLYSDLMVHHMGALLADDIIQGGAGPDEFRTTPLWGVGQRIFFLHDGRTADLQQAIYAHASAATDRFPASEANAVVGQFAQLSGRDQQAILDFLRSL